MTARGAWRRSSGKPKKLREALEAGTEQEELLQFPGKSLRLLGPKRRTLLFFDTTAIVSWEAPWQFPEQSLGGRRALALRMQTSNVSVYFRTSCLSKCRLRGRCYFVRLLAALLMRLLIYEPSRSIARLPEACRKLPGASQSFWRLPETGASRKVPRA